MHIVEYGYVYARVYIYMNDMIYIYIYMKWNGMIWYDMIYTYVNIHYINYIYIIWICISIIRIARKDHKEGGFLQVGHNLDSELIPWLSLVDQYSRETQWQLVNLLLERSDEGCHTGQSMFMNKTIRSNCYAPPQQVRGCLERKKTESTMTLRNTGLGDAKLLRANMGKQNKRFEAPIVVHQRPNCIDFLGWTKGLGFLTFQ